MSPPDRIPNKQRREIARAERKRKEAEQLAKQRRGQRLKRALIVIAVAVAVVAVIIVVGQGSSPSTGLAGGKPAKGVPAATASLAGIPQSGVTLGNPQAKVTINEFGDLQCPVCKVFATDTLDKVIAKLVRTGQAKLVFHNWAIIDQTESVTAAEASYAAAQQNRYWQFIELFYANQGTENTGYITAPFLNGIAKAAGLNVAKFNLDRQNPMYAARVQAAAQQASALGFTGTPSFDVTGPGGSHTLPQGLPTGTSPFEDAVHAAS